VPARACVAIMFGAMLSATDPVAVVALLKELGKIKIIFLIIADKFKLSTDIKALLEVGGVFC